MREAKTRLTRRKVVPLKPQGDAHQHAPSSYHPGPHELMFRRLQTQCIVLATELSATSSLAP